MDLSAEDSFRINVLLANKPQAIKIDESAMVVYGLSEQGEAKVELNPTGRDEPYLRKVRELLSSHLTGSPGGYPVFLKRWTRMGQMRDESLQQLLLLGEPEAVVAAVCSPGIDNDLARRAWWAMEDAENARRMLQSPSVVAGDMGPVLAAYLVDYLPFETETEKMTETVRLVLQPNLLDAQGIAELWKKSARKQAYQVGFLFGRPNALPDPAKPHAAHDGLAAALAGEVARGNPYAVQLLTVYSPSGQTFLKTVRGILKKPPTQDVVTGTLEALASYLCPLRPEGNPDLTLEELQAEANDYFAREVSGQAQACCTTAPDIRHTLVTLRILSGLGYGIVRPIFCDSTAIGSLMRRKLEPVLHPLDELLQSLQS